MLAFYSKDFKTTKAVKNLKAASLKSLKTLNLDVGTSGDLTLEALNNMTKAASPFKTMRATLFWGFFPMEGVKTLKALKITNPGP